MGCGAKTILAERTETSREDDTAFGGERRDGGAGMIKAVVGEGQFSGPEDEVVPSVGHARSLALLGGTGGKEAPP